MQKEFFEIHYVCNQLKEFETHSFSSSVLPRGLSSVNRSITISPNVVSRRTDILAVSKASKKKTVKQNAANYNSSTKPPCCFARMESWVLIYFVMLHAAYIKCCTKERALRSQNKMTSCDEFFGRLRKLAVSVDKESNELKGILENSEISVYNENRACLLLRETLSEVKDCKVHT